MYCTQIVQWNFAISTTSQFFYLLVKFFEKGKAGMKLTLLSPCSKIEKKPLIHRSSFFVFEFAFLSSEPPSLCKCCVLIIQWVLWESFRLELDMTAHDWGLLRNTHTHCCPIEISYLICKVLVSRLSLFLELFGGRIRWFGYVRKFCCTFSQYGNNILAGNGHTFLYVLIFLNKSNAENIFNPI